MITIPFEELNKYEFTISQISSILQKPDYRILINKGRTYNGFIFVEDGEILYEWENSSALIKSGGLIYLPYGSKHRLTIPTKDVAFTRINFTLKNSNADNIIFSDGPLVFTESLETDIIDDVHTLSDEYLHNSRSLYRINLLSRILIKLSSTKKSHRDPRVLSIMEYIRAHFTEKIDFAMLCRTNYLSSSQMYRLFNKEYGYTPGAYQNRLRLEKARQLLHSGDYLIGEVAEILGYESIYYFSRAFKKKFGQAPSTFFKRGV